MLDPCSETEIADYVAQAVCGVEFRVDTHALEALVTWLPEARDTVPVRLARSLLKTA